MWRPEFEKRSAAFIFRWAENDQAAPHVEAAVRLDTELYGPRHRDTIRATNLLTLLLDRTGRGARGRDAAHDETWKRRGVARCRRSDHA